MIPEEKRDAVRVALMVAFGVETYDAIEPLGAGLSTALLFRVEVHGQPYLLRVITRTDARADPTRMFACMEAAADAGIAPRIWYESVEDRVLITDFIETKPFPDDMAERMGAVLRTLHGLKPFPNILNYLDVMDGFVARFVAAGLVPEAEIAEFAAGYARLKAAYWQDDRDMVACHNDLKVENVLFDGERVWLVDWEAGFLNDRYCDLAVVANFFVSDAEEAYLEAYLQEVPGPERMAKFFLMRVRMSAIYAAYFLMLGTGVLAPTQGAVKPMEGEAAFDADVMLPEFGEFHRKMVAGELNLLHRRAQVEYGTVHFREALRWMRMEQFAEALGVV